MHAADGTVRCRAFRPGEAGELADGDHLRHTLRARDFTVGGYHLGSAPGKAMLNLRSNLRGEDVACRYGGEELTLILPDASLEQTRVRADQLGEAARRVNVQHHGRLLAAVTLSIGVAAFPEHGDTAEELLGAADKALYRAKGEGRDRVAVA